MAGPTDAPGEREFPRYFSGTDSVHWVGDTLEYADGSDDWRWERDQTEPTHVEIFKNDTKVASMDLEWESGSVTAITWRDVSSAHWVDSDGEGSITGGSAVGSCDINPEQPECRILPTFWGGDCSSEYDDMQSAIWTAAGSAGVAAVAGAAGGPANPIFIGTAIGAGTAGGFAIGKLGLWLSCKLSTT